MLISKNVYFPLTKNYKIHDSPKATSHLVSKKKKKKSSCTICFSKSKPRLRPLDVEMSSKAFIVTGVLSSSSRLSTTRFWDSNMTQQKQSKHNHPRQSSLKNRLTEKKKKHKSLTPDSSKMA